MNSTIDRVKLLRELGKKIDAWRGESITSIFRRFQRTTSPALSDNILEMKPYDPGWPRLYEAEKQRIQQRLGKITAGMTHMGSTSMPGMSSNSIIDIGLILNDPGLLSSCEETLIELGYRHYGNSPVGPAAQWYWRTGSDPAYVLHVDGPDNRWFDSNINFTRYMTAHPVEREQYLQLKKGMKELKKTDMLLYSLKKLELIIQLFEKADRWAESIK
jgi:GrpB-like predicted nucleotidyltransferase (UPF0157 family)